MENIQNITIDIMNEKYSDYIYCKQYDNNRIVNFTLTENGKKKDISDTYCTFLMKGNGSISFQNLVRVGDVYQLTISPNESYNYGKIPYQLVLTSGEVTIDEQGHIVWTEGSSIIGTVTSYILVEKCVIDEDDAQAQQDASLLEQLLAEVLAAQEVVTTIEGLNEIGQGYANESKSWAIGEGAERPGQDTDNAKYYSERAMTYEESAQAWSDGARAMAQRASGFAEDASNILTEIRNEVMFSHTIVLDKDNWSNEYLTQNITLQGVKANQAEQLIITRPDQNDTEEYARCNVMCIQQATDQLTFKCDEIPTTDLTVYVLLQGLELVHEKDISYSVISATEPENMNTGDFWYQDYE